jgi:hypothetical protein
VSLDVVMSRPLVAFFARVGGFLFGLLVALGS